MSDMEDFEIVRMMVQILEQRIDRAVACRRAALAKVVALKSKDHLFWYVSDDSGNIQILQDAAFVVTGVHLISQEVLGGQLRMSLANGWPRREATQTQNAPVFSAGTLNSFPLAITVSIPIDHFVPAYTNGNTVWITPPNIDYWYQPIADWLIPRGDTIAVAFEGNTSDVHPVVALSGRKVYG